MDPQTIEAQYHEVLRGLFREREHIIEREHAFEAEHEAILNGYREITCAWTAIDTEIRELAGASQAEEIRESRTVIKITRKAAPKSYDAAILLANLSQLEKDEPGLIKKSVDSKRAQALGRKGVIPEKVMLAALKLGAVPSPSVSIETS